MSELIAETQDVHTYVDIIIYIVACILSDVFKCQYILHTYLRKVGRGGVAGGNNIDKIKLNEKNYETYQINK